MTNLANGPLPIFCAKCQKDTYKPLAWIESENNIFLSCDHCGNDITEEMNKTRAALPKIDQLLADDLSKIKGGT
ncbi:hypothetical protein [Thiobacillus sp.]